MATYSDGWTEDDRISTLRAIAGDPRCSPERRSEALGMLAERRSEALGMLADVRRYKQPDVTRVGPVRSGSLREFEEPKP